MKRCKIHYCNEPVDPLARKQHCTLHMNNYNERRAEFLRVQETLPKCANFDVCGGKVSPLKLDYCNDCRAMLNKKGSGLDWDAHLRACKTVEDLKLFISEHLSKKE